MRNSAICLRAVGGTLEFDGRPNEVPDPVPFAEDRGERPYDADAVTRFFHATVAVDRVFKLFRTGFKRLSWCAIARIEGSRIHPGRTTRDHG
jgi:hypothetical protein